MKTPLILTSLILTAMPVLAGPPPPVMVQPPPATTPSGWQFRAVTYLWAQALDGTMGVKGLEADVNLDFSDILSDLDFAYMGAFEARNGRWGILADLNYAEISDSVSGANVLFSSGDFKQKQFLGNFTLNCRVLESDSTVVDLYAGARVNWIDADINLRGVEGGVLSRSGDDSWTDAIVGARFQTSLSDKWFFRASGDIGGGSSDFTWQAMGIFGYKVSDRMNVGIGYRGLGTDYHNGGFTYDITAHGPVLGMELRW